MGGDEGGHRKRGGGLFFHYNLLYHPSRDLFRGILHLETRSLIPLIRHSEVWRGRLLGRYIVLHEFRLTGLGLEPFVGLGLWGDCHRVHIWGQTDPPCHKSNGDSLPPPHPTPTFSLYVGSFTLRFSPLSRYGSSGPG